MKIRRTSGSFVIDELLRFVYVEAREEHASVPTVAELWTIVLEVYFDTPHRGFFTQVRPSDTPGVSTALCTIQDWAIRQVVYVKCYQPSPTSQKQALAEQRMTDFCREKLTNYPGWEFVIAMVCFGTEANVWKVDADGICGTPSGYIDADCADTKAIRNVLDEIQFPWSEEDEEEADDEEANQEAGFGDVFEWLKAAFSFFRSVVGWTGD